MSTMTAQLLIGSAHPYDGGINPEYIMFLSENTVARWTLIEANLSAQRTAANPIVAQWIPTIEFMLEDALIMIGLYILKDEEMLRLAKCYFISKAVPHFILYEDAAENGLKLLRERARQLDYQFKITLSIFYGSTILKQFPVLENYKMDVEVCLPVFAREYSVWSKQAEVRGELKSI